MRTSSLRRFLLASLVLALGFAAAAACTEFESASDGARADAEALADDGAATRADEGSATDAAADADLLRGRGRFEGPGECSTFALGADAAVSVVDDGRAGAACRICPSAPFVLGDKVDGVRAGRYRYRAYVRHPADASAGWPVLLGAHSYDANPDGGDDLAISEGFSEKIVPDARWAEVTATFDADGGGQAVRYFVLGPGATSGCVDIDDMTLTLDP